MTFLRAHFDHFVKLSNPALMTSHMYVEFDRKLLSSVFLPPPFYLLLSLCFIRSRRLPLFIRALLLLPLAHAQSMALEQLKIGTPPRPSGMWGIVYV